MSRPAPPTAAATGPPSRLGELVGAERTGPGRWRASVPPDWWAWTGPHGGVLAALATGAAYDLAGSGARTRTVEVAFVGRAGAGPVDLEATPVRLGRGFRVVCVRALQQDALVLTASVSFTATPGHSESEGAQLQAPVAPQVPAAGDCEPSSLPPKLTPVGAHTEIRPAAGELPLSGARAASMCAWLRLRPALPIDDAVALVLADALPPGIFPLLRAPVPIPTAQLSVHLHADLRTRPLEGHVLAVQRNVTTGGGWSIDEAELWSDTGRLLAQARQLRRTLGPLDLPRDPSEDRAPGRQR